MIEPNNILLRRTIEAAYNANCIDLAEYNQALDYMDRLERHHTWKEFDRWLNEEEDD